MNLKTTKAKMLYSKINLLIVLSYLSYALDLQDSKIKSVTEAYNQSINQSKLNVTCKKGSYSQLMRAYETVIGYKKK